MSDLSKRAVAWKGWRWMAGMLTTDGWRLALLQSDGRWLAVNERTSSVSARVDVTGALPDLSDPATLGCLLHLVREAHSRPRLAVLTIGTASRVGDAMGWIGPSAEDGEIAALIAALEAAPAGTED